MISLTHCESPNNGFWSFPELASNCADDDYDKGGSILHEFTHLVSDPLFPSPSYYFFRRVLEESDPLKTDSSLHIT